MAQYGTIYLYRGLEQYGAEHAVARGAEEALTWDFTAQPRKTDAADPTGSAACGGTQRSVTGLRRWLAPVRRWAARRAVSERA
jgi:hypothetical protein